MDIFRRILLIACHVFLVTGSFAGSDLESLLPQLNEYIDGQPNVNITEITEQGERHTSHVFYAEPKSVKQIQQLVNAANKFGLQVRAVGSGHSYSPVYPDTGALALNLFNLEEQAFTLDKERTRASVLASATVQEFYKFNKANRVTVPSAPVIAPCSFQGMTATASIGAAPTEASPASRVVAMDLVDGNGDIRHFDEETEPDVLRACRAHLGLCGIIYNTTVKVVPDEAVKFSHSLIPVDAIIFNRENRRAFVNSHFAINTMWNIYNGATAQQRRYTENDGLSRAHESWTAKQDMLDFWTASKVDQSGDYNLNGDIQHERLMLQDNTMYHSNYSYITLSDSLLFESWGEDRCTKINSVTGFATPETEDFTASSKTLENSVHIIEKGLKNIGLVNKLPYGYFRWQTHNPNCLFCHTKVAGKNGMTLVQSLVFRYNGCLHRTPSDKDIRGLENFEMLFTDGMLINATRIATHWAKYDVNTPHVPDLIREVFKNELSEFIATRNKHKLDVGNIFMNDHLRDIFRNEKLITGNGVSTIHVFNMFTCLTVVLGCLLF
ncbi:unnamed protein product [Owenia fusiformis]|uniref:Uncharacterized protein n=1 Tax=Owenia fusiformis TaxID=6347 RepID=A0A8J1XPR3_OWEFU|nr:unnamed protein product [Owenia fusiformis]